MKSIGIIKKLEKLGRLYIPKKVVKELNLSSFCEIVIYFENDLIILKKYEPKRDKFSYIVQLDLNGKLVIPVKIRKRFGLEENKSCFEFFIEDDQLILKQFMPEMGLL